MNLWNRYRNWLRNPARHHMNWPEWITAGMTIVLATIAFLQLQVYRQQKKIMESSGKQTDQLITAAIIQAGAATKNADSAASMAESTGKQATEAKNISAQTLAQAQATNQLARQAARSADAANRAADTAASQFELSERPWVDAEVSIDGPFDFNVNGASFHLKFRLLNTGHSPAFATVIEGMPVDSFAVGTGDASQYRDQVCQSATRMVQESPHAGVALFPNNSFDQSISWTFPNDEISKAHGLGSRIPGVIVWPSIVICIGYRAPFNQLNVYHTSYIFDFSKVDPSNRSSVDFKIGEDVDRDHLRLQCHVVKCITAD